jgi:hypothetical protein
MQERGHIGVAVLDYVIAAAAATFAKSWRRMCYLTPFQLHWRHFRTDGLMVPNSRTSCIYSS